MNTLISGLVTHILYDHIGTFLLVNSMVNTIKQIIPFPYCSDSSSLPVCITVAEAGHDQVTY